MTNLAIGFVIGLILGMFIGAFLMAIVVGDDKEWNAYKKELNF